MITVDHQHRELADQVQALSQHVRDGRIVCFIIIGIEIQDFSGQTVHHVAARSLHDNVTHKVRRKRSSLHQSLMKHLKFGTTRKFTK